MVAAAAQAEAEVPEVAAIPPDAAAVVAFVPLVRVCALAACDLNGPLLDAFFLEPPFATLAGVCGTPRSRRRS